jgi:hypothetical protein
MIYPDSRFCVCNKVFFESLQNINNDHIYFEKSAFIQNLEKGKNLPWKNCVQWGLTLSTNYSMTANSQ